jgi:hypothetical protein
MYLSCPCSALNPVQFLLGVLKGSLPLVLVAGSFRGSVYWTSPFLVDIFIIFQVSKGIFADLAYNCFWGTVGSMSLFRKNRFSANNIFLECDISIKLASL